MSNPLRPGSKSRGGPGGGAFTSMVKLSKPQWPDKFESPGYGKIKGLNPLLNLPYKTPRVIKIKNGYITFAQGKNTYTTTIETVNGYDSAIIVQGDGWQEFTVFPFNPDAEY